MWPPFLLEQPGGCLCTEWTRRVQTHSTTNLWLRRTCQHWHTWAKLFILIWAISTDAPMRVIVCIVCMIYMCSLLGILVLRVKCRLSLTRNGNGQSELSYPPTVLIPIAVLTWGTIAIMSWLVSASSAGSRISQTGRGRQPKVGMPTYYLANFPQKTSWKKLDRGSTRPCCSPRSANDFLGF